MEQQHERFVMFGVDITPAPWPQTPIERLAGQLWGQLERCRDQLADAHAELRAGTVRHEAILLASRVGAGAAVGLAIAGAILGADQLAEVLR